MKNYGFNKLLILPSNGLEYSKFCYLKPVTLEYFLFADDLESEILNKTELYTSVLRQYLELPVDITELYTSDLYFLWINFIMQILEDKYFIDAICGNQECKYENKLEIDLFKIDIEYCDSKDIHKSFDVLGRNTNITFRRRKVKDNLDFGIKNLISNNEFSISQIIEYVISQITKIVSNTKVIDPNFYKEFMTEYFQNQDIVKIFHDNFTSQDFGIKNNIKYHCKSCKHENHTEFFNNYGNSILITERDVKNQKSEVFKMLLNMSRTPAITMDEILRLPYSAIDDLSKSLSEIKFEAIM